MTRIIISLVIILMASSCNRNQNSEGKINNVRKTIVVQAKKRIYHDDGTRTYTDWVDFKTRSLQQLTAYEAPKNPVRKSKWGGRRDSNPHELVQI